jgi:hypothetical protein
MFSVQFALRYYKQNKSRECSTESWDGSQNSRKLVVIVNMEAQSIGKDTADLEDIVQAVVNCSVCELEVAV